MIEKVIEQWVNVWFSFDKGERSRRSSLLEHKWFTCQSEICTNIIFKSKGYFDKVYEKILEKHHRIGLPDRLSNIFELKRERIKSESSQKTYNNKACVKHWIEGNSIKMYNKGGYLLRVETTINNPRLPGAELQKPIYYIKGYYWYGYGCNNRFLEAISDVDVSQLQANGEKYTQSVVKETGKLISAPDLRNPKQIALITILLNGKYSAEWFRLKDLKRCLSGSYSKTAEIRYQLQKLLVRGLVEKKQHANYYRVTKEGYIWMYISYCQMRYFVSPSLSKLFGKEQREELKKLDKFEESITNLHDSLSYIYQQLSIVA
jgi:hypothetical protein